MCHQHRRKRRQNSQRRKLRVEFLHSSSARLFRPSSKLRKNGFDHHTESRAMNRIRFWTSLTSGRALHCCKKNSFISTCLVFRVDSFRLMMLTAAEESKSAYPPLACESNTTLACPGIGVVLGKDGLGLLTVGARPERRREPPRSISEKETVELLSHTPTEG